MKGVPAYLVACGVVVVAAAFVYMVAVAGGSTREEIAKLQSSVDSLRDEVRELRAVVGVTAQRMGAFNTPSKPSHVPVATEGSPPSDGGKPAVEETEGPAPETTGGDELLDDGVNLEPVDVVLAIAADHTCRLDGREVAKEDLAAELKRVLRARPAMQLLIKADASIPMAEVDEVVDLAKKAGIYRSTIVPSGDSDE